MASRHNSAPGFPMCTMSRAGRRRPRAVFPGSRASRGQIISAELVIASSIFLASLAVFLLAWNSIFFSYSEEKADQQMQLALLGISDTLVLSPGQPADWESGAMQNASAIGLADSKSVLSEAKLAALESLNSSYYTQVKESMGAGALDVFIRVSLGSEELYSFGRPADLSASSVSAASVDRLAMLNGSVADVKVQLWRMKGKIL